MKIDLGRKREEFDGPEVSVPSPEVGLTYPCLYLRDVPELLKLGKSGEAVIEYKVIEKEVSVCDKDGKEKAETSVELEIRTLTPKKSKTSKEVSTEEALDSLLAKVLK